MADSSNKTHQYILSSLNFWGFTKVQPTKVQNSLQFAVEEGKYTHYAPPTRTGGSAKPLRTGKLTKGF
jgi:hypothetical protein